MPLLLPFLLLLLPLCLLLLLLPFQVVVDSVVDFDAFNDALTLRAKRDKQEEM